MLGKPREATIVRACQDRGYLPNCEGPPGENEPTLLSIKSVATGTRPRQIISEVAEGEGCKIERYCRAAEKYQFFIGSPVDVVSTRLASVRDRW